MVKLLIELLEFLRSCAPLLTSLAILTLLCILLFGSIRKHATAYYIVLGIPFALVVFPFIGRLSGFEMLSFAGVPFLGEIVRDYIHMGTFGHPLLIVIMYMGALNPKFRPVKKLLSIRKELSIISGFAVFTHSLIRVTNNFPKSFRFFTNHAEYMANTKVVSELGAGISSFSFVLGVVMLILFIPLWVTSFSAVRKRMGYVKWKKLQRWSYVLYATLFIHAMGIQIGGLLNPRDGNTSRPAAVETTVVQERAHDMYTGTTAPAMSEQGIRDSEKVKPLADKHGEMTRSSSGGRQNEQVTRPATGGRVPVKGFSVIEVSARTKGYIHIVSLILIYGSYLYLRLRKARKGRMTND